MYTFTHSLISKFIRINIKLLSDANHNLILQKFHIQKGSKIFIMTTHNSKISKSTIKQSVKSSIKQQKFQQMEEKFSKIRYPVHPVSIVQPFKKKLNSCNVKQIRQMLEQLGRLFNSYRNVRGDGNCFFRALAFIYISSIKSYQIQDCFPQLNSLSLTVCKQQSIKSDLLEFYQDKFLKTIIINHWKKQYKPLVEKAKGNYHRALCNLLSDYHYFDFIMILYFRSLCLRGLQMYKQKLKQFLNGTQQDQIKTYSRQSQGIVIDICARLLKISIFVYEIRPKEIIPYQYCHETNPKIKASLIYADQHYDIVENNDESQIKLQKMDKKESIEYYSQVNKNIQKGVCIQCGKNGQVYQENSLCSDCYNMSVSGLLNFKKDKFVQGRCENCYRHALVLETVGMCKNCIEKQSDIINNKFKCIRCLQPCEFNGICQSCRRKAQKIRGKCPQCNYTQYIDPELGLCEYCIRIQKKHEDYLIQNARTKRCQQCRQKVDLRKVNEHICKNICKKCSKITYNQNSDNLCISCERQKKIQDMKMQTSSSTIQDTSKIKGSQVRPTYSKMKCSLCRQFTMTGDPCSKCKLKQKGRIQKPSNDSYQTHKCKKCQHIKLTEHIIDGLCKSCRQKPSINLDNKCKACNRIVAMYLIKDGHCYQCRNSRVRM